MTDLLARKTRSAERGS